MDIDDNGWLAGIKHIPSPFFDQRPNLSDISLLVVHNISLPPGQYGGDAIERFFTGRLSAHEHPFFPVIHKMRVSAHCLIRRTGEVVQFVSFKDRAWHAGKSCFAGRENCNDYSIGIELEGTDYESYTQEQYRALVQVSHLLTKQFPLITKQRITGHQYIAPMRKSDPGLVFDWRFYLSQLN